MDMMQFEGKEVIMGKVSKNAMLPKLIQDVMALAMAVEQLTGRTDILPELVNRYGLSDDIGGNNTKSRIISPTIQYQITSITDMKEG